ncbi:hypothetical protein P5704_025400 (plasmid) [Pseudomonas sp. FeN3W]|nr:hypothetical protein P5704_025400 [Pseudomonas sp. FeN3W]
MSIESIIGELYSEAIRESRGDIVSAILPFISLREVVQTLEKAPYLFNDKFKQGLLRSAYSAEDLNGLFQDSLVKNIPGYAAFLNSLADQPLDEESRGRLIRTYMSRSMYDLALTAHSGLIDKDAFAKELITDVKLFSSRYSQREGLFIFVGHPSNWDEHAIVLLSKLGLEMPDDFSQYEHTSRNYPWTLKRFQAQVDLVGETLKELKQGIPLIKEIKSGKPEFATGKMLAEAFRVEALRLNQPDTSQGWNARNFPKYLPVLVEPALANAVEAAGGVRAMPVTQKETSSSVVPYRGFKVSGNNCVEDVEAAMAMTLLPHESVSRILESKSHITMLIPYSSISEQSVEVDEKLSTAMRYHRPEVVEWLTGSRPQQYSLFSNDIGTRLYLRGAYWGQSLQNSVVSITHDACSVSTLKLMTTSHEVEFMRKYLSETIGTYRNEQQSVHIMQSCDDIDQALEDFKKELRYAKEYLGFTPYISLKGSLEYLEKVSWLKEDFNLQNASAQDPSLPMKYETICGAYGISKELRLGARLGGAYKRLASNFGETPQALLTKSSRLKDPEDIEKIKGLLDRFDIMEVVKAASTEKQIEFVVNNFDLSGVLDKLDNKIRRRVGREKLSTDFEL